MTLSGGTEGNGTTVVGAEPGGPGEKPGTDAPGAEDPGRLGTIDGDTVEPALAVLEGGTAAGVLVFGGVTAPCGVVCAAGD